LSAMPRRVDSQSLRGPDCGTLLATRHRTVAATAGTHANRGDDSPEPRRCRSSLLPGFKVGPLRAGEPGGFLCKRSCSRRQANSVFHASSCILMRLESFHQPRTRHHDATVSSPPASTVARSWPRRRQWPSLLPRSGATTVATPRRSVIRTRTSSFSTSASPSTKSATRPSNGCTRELCGPRVRPGTASRYLLWSDIPMIDRCAG